ncbi:branched-chain amino acid transport system 3 carrier protein [Candidatus Photodesmus blepharus]|uniref:Branched-chain amino acid transport system 3 carrier protein n=2 Tax=Candidatus Photodesmus blepharonis TaxID=1179155 RepID=A0A084CNF8_9GAMM|nr:branched-chain amino acid transport system 3 carrier protein [Candidatus Photodesmus blepharus]
MCGGIASALSLNRAHHDNLLPLYYNFGRLSSYTIFGGLIGGMFASITCMINLTSSLVFFRLISAIFMIILALYLFRVWFGLLHIEKIGQIFWKHISPIGKIFLPLKKPFYAFPLGFLWGWFPCGLVYSTLTWAAASGSMINGAIIMLSFGIGTLPTMLLISYSFNYLEKLQLTRFNQNLGALSILIYGLYTAYESIIMILISF